MSLKTKNKNKPSFASSFAKASDDKKVAQNKKIAKQGMSFIRALKKAELPEYVDVVTNPWKIFFFSIIRGTGFGLGTLLGATIVITILSYVVHWLTAAPYFGEFFKDVAVFFRW